MTRLDAPWGGGERRPCLRVRLSRALMAATAAVLACLVPAAAGDSHGDLRPAPTPVSAPATDRAPSALIELDGSESYNPEGEDLHFQWRQVKGPRVELSDPNAAKPYFRTSQPGYYVFELVVTANGMKSEPLTLDFEIEMMNLPPVAKAPAEVHGEVGKPLEIDAGESFDPEGANLTYRWRPLTRGLDIPLSALNRPVLSFQPTLDGVFEVELVVSDGETASQPVVTRLLIRPQPRPPVARAKINTLEIPTVQPEQAMAPPAGSRPIAMIQGPAVVQMGKPVMLDARGSRGTTDNRLEYLWRQKSGPFVSDFEVVFDGAAERFLPPRIGDYEFELIVSDGTRESEPAVHRIKVIGEPQPPVAVVNYPSRAVPGTKVTMDATQSYDIEGSELTYHWRQTGGPRVRNYVIDEQLGKKAPTFYPEAPGVYSFELVVGNGTMRSKPFEIDIEVGDVRRPPNITISGPEVTNIGERVQLIASAEDEYDRRLSFVWRQIEGPAPALPETNGTIAVIAPTLPGRYVIDLAAVEHNIVVATARRTLEVFERQGARSGAMQPAPAAGAAPMAPTAGAPRYQPPPQQQQPYPQTAAPAGAPRMTPSPAGPRPATAAPPAQPMTGTPFLPPAPPPVAGRAEPQRGGTRPAAQIHPSTAGGALAPLAPLEPIQPLRPQ